jgi:hypothetical protein
MNRVFVLVAFVLDASSALAATLRTTRRTDLTLSGIRPLSHPQQNSLPDADQRSGELGLRRFDHGGLRHHFRNGFVI